MSVEAYNFGFMDALARCYQQLLMDAEAWDHIEPAKQALLDTAAKLKGLHDKATQVYKWN